MATVSPGGESLGTLQGRAIDLLTTERLVLNIVSRLCGVATLTARYTEQLRGTTARLYDTRKTTTGWRRLEKYAVGCGGGFNHRSGLYDAFLIKDNHLALGGTDGVPLSPAAAIRRARELRDQHQRTTGTGQAPIPRIIEIEVDSLDQLRDCLPESPDIVLVDNFPLENLKQAVSLRNEINRQVQLEASGGVTIETIAAIAKTGVERISCGALTHQATWLDLGLDWRQ
jgi:nicotinate-nucleotide pyrophosphorylase (carboxylating)